MSLKAFHVIFITAATAMAVGCGVWGFKNYFSQDGSWPDLAFGIISVLAGVGLVVYERFFLKKFKNVSYI